MPTICAFSHAQYKYACVCVVAEKHSLLGWAQGYKYLTLSIMQTLWLLFVSLLDVVSLLFKKWSILTSDCAASVFEGSVCLRKYSKILSKFTLEASRVVNSLRKITNYISHQTLHCYPVPLTIKQPLARIYSSVFLFTLVTAAGLIRNMALLGKLTSRSPSSSM